MRNASPMSLPGSALPVQGPATTPPPVPRLASAYRTLEHGLDMAFGAAANPLKHLGALGFMLLWLLVASGSILYIVLDTSAAGAYQSIAALADVPWMLGTALRGVHRYAADAFVVVMGMHILREWLLGRYRHWRRAIWWTGVPLVGLAFVSAVGGFWLNWDQLGQFSAVATADWLDALPLGASLARNFLGDVASATGCSRCSSSCTSACGAADGVRPVVPHPADRARQGVSATPRWPGAPSCTCCCWPDCYPCSQPGRPTCAPAHGAGAGLVLLFMHPLVDATSPPPCGRCWAWPAALLALPFLPQSREAPVAVVDPDNCNGCRRCFDDCPYSAITMVPHPNGKRACAWRRSTPTCAPAAASAPAPARRPRRFAASRAGHRHRHAAMAGQRSAHAADPEAWLPCLAPSASMVVSAAPRAYTRNCKRPTCCRSS
jgi:ferredoxin